jgi:hypothetical protein
MRKRAEPVDRKTNRSARHPPRVFHGGRILSEEDERRSHGTHRASGDIQDRGHVLSDQ